MAFYVTKELCANNRGLSDQAKFIANTRAKNFAYQSELIRAGALQVNADLFGPAVWKDFDTQTRDILANEPVDPLFTDLQGLAKNVNIGKIVSEYRNFSANEYEVRSSIDGQHAKPVNHVSYEADGALVLVHSTQVGRNWRELEGLRSAGYDLLLDDQAVAVRDVRKRTVDNYINGTADLTYRGYASLGIKNNPNTVAVNLTVDLTNPALTAEQLWTAMTGVIASVTGTGNANIYLSKEIWANFLRLADPSKSITETLLNVAGRVPGIGAIKRSPSLSGKELMVIIPSAQYIQPIVGMPITTTPIVRVTPMDDYHVLVWGASGLAVKGTPDNAGVIYATQS